MVMTLQLPPKQLLKSNNCFHFKRVQLKGDNSYFSSVLQMKFSSDPCCISILQIATFIFPRLWATELFSTWVESQSRIETQFELKWKGSKHVKPEDAFQLRAIRAFRSTLEEMEEKLSVISVHSLRSTWSVLNRPVADFSYIDERSVLSAAARGQSCSGARRRSSYNGGELLAVPQHGMNS